MSDALTRLGRETTTVGNLLGDAVRRLAADRDAIGTSLGNAVADIDSLAAGVDGGAEDSVGWSDGLDGSLRSAYTMACERQIHQMFLRAAASEAPRPDVDEAPFEAVA